MKNHLKDVNATDLVASDAAQRADQPVPFHAQRQRAEVSLMLRPDAGFRARAEITNGGLLSIAVLVSSILLSTAVLVHVAVQDGRRSRFPWRATGKR